MLTAQRAVGGVDLAFGAPTAESQPLFDADEPLIMRLGASFGLLQRQKDRDPKGLDGPLILTDVGTGDDQLKVVPHCRESRQF